MKKSNLVLLMIVLVCLLLAASICNGAAVTPKWVAYDYKDKVEPPTGFDEGTSKYPMANYCTIANGALVMNTMADLAAGPAYKLKLTDSPKVGFKFTMVVRAKADAENGMDYDFRCGFRERIRLLSSGIELNTSKVKDTSVKTKDWHTYFMSFEIINDAGANMLLTKIYVDGSLSPVVQGKSSTVDTDNNYLKMGDGSSTAGYAGSTDWLMYTFDGAYSPEQVMLPEGYSLK